MAKLIARHIKLITFLYIFVSAMLIVSLSNFEVLKPLYIWIVFVLATFAYVIAISCIHSKYQKKVVEEFENTCKPQRYVEFFTLCYKGNSKSIVNQMNYVAALTLDRNSLQTARKLMETMQVHKIPERAANIRFVFYNNLTSIYMDLNEIDKAERAYNKAVNYYNQIKNETIKNQMTSKLATLCCGIAIINRDLDTALANLSGLKADTLLEKVSYALILVKIHILKNETEMAKEQLSFVIENAREISYGQEAEELLLNIS